MKSSSLIPELILELDSILKDKDIIDQYALELVCSIREVSLHKDLVAIFAEGGGFERVVTLIERTSVGDRICFLCVEILWNAVEKNQIAKEILGTFYCMKILYESIDALTNTGYRQRDKELRNDILIVLCFVAEVKSTHRNFIDTGLLTLLLQLCFEDTDLESSRKSKSSAVLYFMNLCLFVLLTRIRIGERFGSEEINYRTLIPALFHKRMCGLHGRVQHCSRFGFLHSSF